MRALWIALLPLFACLPDPEIDAIGPQLLRFELEGEAQHLAGRRVPVRPRIELSFDGSLDPESVHAGTLSLRRMQEHDACVGLTPCTKGRCVSGRCVQSDLDEGDLDDLFDGEYLARAGPSAPQEAEVELRLLNGPAGPRSRLRIEPRRALWGDAHYELVVGGLRDAAGNPLRRWIEEGTPHRFSWSTRKAGSSGPEAELRRPLPGARALPTNLASVELHYVAPVDLDFAGRSEAWASLESESGEVIVLRLGRPCANRPPGSCAIWEPQAHLQPATRYRLGPSSVRDGRGRASVLPADAAWFETGAGRDDEAPKLELHAWSRAHCLHLGLHASEPLQLAWTAGAESFESDVFGWVEWGSAVPPTQGELEWSLEAADLAGNRASLTGVETPQTTPSPSLAITEVLANPLGAEPKAEFVELASTVDAPQSTEGVYLADRSWAEVRAALERGGEPPGDPLPSLILEAREVVLLVSDGFPGDSEVEDVPVPSETRLIFMGSSLGDGGLKNAGEELVLYRADPPELLSSYGNWIATDASEFGGVSVERISVSSCDGPGDWRANHAQGATPGRLP